MKHATYRKLRELNKSGRTRFISAEGCYSHAAANMKGIRIKFASKAFADWSNNVEFYVVRRDLAEIEPRCAPRYSRDLAETRAEIWPRSKRDQAAP